MNRLYFFRKRETKRPILQKNTTQSLLQGLVILSIWLLSSGNMWSQTAPNISYATPQNYLLNALITPLTPVNASGTVPALTYKKVSTFAGTTAGFLDGTGTAAMMNGPLGMKMDTSGNIYFIDGNNFRIRKLNTQTGEVTTIAGDGYRFAFFGREKNDPNGALASFNYPTDLALDTANNCLYVTDKENDVIRKVSLSGTYAVTTFAGSGTSSSTDGTGLVAKFKKPSGIVIDPTGTYLYVTDRSGNKIRRITISTAVVTTIAGSGTQSTVNNTTGTSATFNNPTGIAVDANYIYVTDFEGNKIRKISKTSPYAVTTLAGSGAVGTADNTIGALATFNNPYGLTIDPAGNLFVAEYGNKIRIIIPSGTVTTFAGSGASTSIDGIGTAAAFDSPSHIILNPTTGVGYVSDYASDRIRKIELGGYSLTPSLPTGMSFDVTTGTFSGTPTAINNGPITYTITADNYYGSSTATVSITTASLAVITTTASSAITGTSVTTGGTVSSTGGSALIAKGICWNTYANPTILDNKLADSSLVTGSFTSNIAGLAPLTTYYARAYATNIFGTSYGAQVSFTTLIAPPAIGYTTFNVYTLNTAISPLQATNTGGSAAQYTVTPPLPPGLVFNADGSITGTPTEPSPATIYTITATNAGGSNTATISIATGNVPDITTAPAGDITTFSASVGCDYLYGNGFAISDKGICWSTSPNPTIADYSIAAGSSNGFYFTVSEFLPSTTYYLRAFATNDIGTGYGNEIVFTTLANEPAIRYNATNQFTLNTAITPLQASNTGGTATQYTVTPSLPAGLVLNADGSITGTPTVASPAATYTITATNTGGFGTFTISIEVTSRSAPAPMVSAQSFCNGATVADLVATGTDLKWYAVAIDGTALSTSTALAAGTYYVSQTINGSESTRTSVAVTVNNSIAGTITANQTVTLGAQPNDITLTNSSGSVQWQASTDGVSFSNIDGATETTLLGSTIGALTANKYFRAIVNDGGCAIVTSGTVAVITTTTTNINSLQCGTTLAALNTTITFTPVANAISYKFKIVDTNTNKTRYYVSSTNSFNLAKVSGTLYSTPYAINIAATIGRSLKAYGEACTVTTPDPNTKIQEAQCGQTLSFVGSNIVANAVTGVTNYRFKVAANGEERIIETVSRMFQLTSLVGGALHNTAYTISVATKYNGVWKDYGTLCIIRTPSGLTKIQDSQSGITLPTLGTSINANAVSKATNYRFKVLANGEERTIETVSRTFRLTSLLGGAFFNTEYTISVATKYNGVWGDYGSSCVIRTPTGLTKIQDSQCGTTIPTLGTSIVANGVSGVTHYRFKVVANGVERTIERTSRTFQLTTLLGGVVNNTTYTISVATKYNGKWGDDYGAECTVSTPSTITARVAKPVTTAVAKVKVSDDSSVLAYPSPFTTNFKLNFISSNTATIAVAIYDMTGRQIENRNLTSSEINNLELGDNYPSGVYNVLVTQGAEIKMLRLIKK